MSANYEISKTGFTVTDTETRHILHVKFEKNKYHGIVIIPEQNQQLPLAPWGKGENPFKNDLCFEGMQTGYAPEGYWWFKIRPSSPFSTIMKEVEELNKKFGFLKKLLRKDTVRLTDIVHRKHKTGYIFIDINNDLGDAAEEIMANTANIKMAYGYARRTAVAALYIQGIVDKDLYDHVLTVFKSLQIQTEHTVEFQEQAFSESMEFIKSYNPLISTFLAKKIIAIAQDYEIPEGQLDDAQLIKEVLDIAHEEQPKQ